MNSLTRADREELLSLVAAYCDEKISNTCGKRLEHILGASIGARALYVDFLDLHLSLLKNSRTRAGQQQNLFDVSSRSRFPANAASPLLQRGIHHSFNAVATYLRHSSIAATLLVATALYGCFGLAVWQMSRYSASPATSLGMATNVSASHSQMESHQETVEIARLTVSVDARWAASNDQVDGARLRSGQQLRLVSGVVQLDFDKGARVTIEGPCEFEVVSANSGYLQLGKLVAFVPSSAVGFRMQTPTATVIDLGTEFGVEVDPTGVEQVHVLEGGVQLSPAFPNMKTSNGVVELRAGEGARWKNEGAPIQPIVANANRFVRNARSQKAIDLEIGPDYAAAVKKSAPIVYWRFERERNGLVPNEMGDRWPARLGGEILLGGPATNRRVVFRDNYGPKWIEVDEPVTDLANHDFSIELWVKPTRFAESDLVTGFLGRANGPLPPCCLSLMLQDASGNEGLSGAVRFLHRSPPGDLGGVDVCSPSPYLPGHWHHLAGVKHDTELALYVNGQLVNKAMDAAVLTVAPYVLIGRHRSDYSDPDPRQLTGELDEVALYNRALSADEIRQHFGQTQHNRHGNPLNTHDEGTTTPTFSAPATSSP